jgi:uncharacterized protein (DUF1800 family)
MNRFGLGRRGEEAVPADPAAWLAVQLEGPDPALARPGHSVEQGLVAWREDLARGNDGIQASRAIMAADTAAWLDHAVATDAPFRERLVWFWANHFTVSLRRGAVVPLANAFVREAIRPHVTGRFGDMLGAVMRHPAMLYYLDNAQSAGPASPLARRASGRRVGLNENLARECLELHTATPASGYAQADVEQMALVLTGWSVALRRDPPGPLFRPALHQPGPKTVLGERVPEGPEGLVLALAFLARHPATLRNLATKLVRHFVSDAPDPSEIDHVAGVLAATDGNLKAAALAVASLERAWVPLAKLRTPTDFVLAVVRALDLPPGSGARLRAAIGSLGQGVMNAPLPNGWPDTAQDWASPEALMRRIDWAHAAAARGAGLEPMAVAERALGPLLGAATRGEIMRAGSRREALALLFASPEFQRR